MRRSPPPSKSSERVMEYLDIVKSAQTKRGFAKRYDILKKAMNEAYTDYIIKYLKDSGLIKGDDDEERYYMTIKGEAYLYVFKKHRDLVGLFTTELSGERIKRW
jgi:predicted transcriptional regulator